ncbi:MAG: bifunctional 23S rRNA (guanine(2069)-N(7))-methyltransferase RlmK/23S rRNA (guanine(2445)-N(2))-methyltransferase RlmL [Candidatus Competibacterales bacterium]
MTTDSPPPVPLPAEAMPFYNRLRKNRRALERWATRENIHCWRLYDADLPEFALAIDRYEDWLHVQEYAPPPSVDKTAAARRLALAKQTLPLATDIPETRTVFKTRQRQRGQQQYQRQGQQGAFMTVREGPARLWVNLTDYLDTGLFLDHRPVRRWLMEKAAGKRFLNVFAYTGSATVFAAVGGATTTTTVDLSATYLDWARRNLALNGFEGPRHRLVRADCTAWLSDDRGTYDLIFIDPPTFSNSKRMADSFDVQRDHGELLAAAWHRTAPGGEVIFSNNFRRFKLDRGALDPWIIDDLTAPSIPKDFARRPRIHCCFRLRRP